MPNLYEIQADGVDGDRKISGYLEPSVRELENKNLRFSKLMRLLLLDYHGGFTDVCICQNSSNINGYISLYVNYTSIKLIYEAKQASTKGLPSKTNICLKYIHSISWCDFSCSIQIEFFLNMQVHVLERSICVFIYKARGCHLSAVLKS